MKQQMTTEQTRFRLVLAECRYIYLICSCCTRWVVSDYVWAWSGVTGHTVMFSCSPWGVHPLAHTLLAWLIAITDSVLRQGKVFCGFFYCQTVFLWWIFWSTAMFRHPLYAFTCLCCHWSRFISEGLMAAGATTCGVCCLRQGVGYVVFVRGWGMLASSGGWACCLRQGVGYVDFFRGLGMLSSSGLGYVGFFRGLGMLSSSGGGVCCLLQGVGHVVFVRGWGMLVSSGGWACCLNVVSEFSGCLQCMCMLYSGCRMLSLECGHVVVSLCCLHVRTIFRLRDFVFGTQVCCLQRVRWCYLSYQWRSSKLTCEGMLSLLSVEIL